MAGRHLDGRDDLCGGYSPRGDRLCREERDRGKLALVEFCHERDDDGVSLCSPVAKSRSDDRRGVCRTALFRKAGGLSARVPRALPGPADQLHHYGLGQPRDGQNPARHPRGRRTLGHADSSRYAPLHGLLHHDLRPMGRTGDRSFPIRSENGDGHSAGYPRREGRRGDRCPQVEDCAARCCGRTDRVAAFLLP